MQVLNVEFHLLILIHEDVPLLDFYYSVFEQTLDLLIIKRLQVDLLEHFLPHDVPSEYFLNFSSCLSWIGLLLANFGKTVVFGFLSHIQPLLVLFLQIPDVRELPFFGVFQIVESYLFFSGLVDVVLDNLLVVKLLI